MEPGGMRHRAGGSGSEGLTFEGLGPRWRHSYLDVAAGHDRVAPRAPERTQAPSQFSTAEDGLRLTTPLSHSYRAAAPRTTVGRTRSSVNQDLS